MLINTNRLLFLAGMLTTLAYWPGLLGPFFFDDLHNLTENQTLVNLDLTEADSWRTAAYSSTAGMFYRPLSMITFAVNLSFAGEFTPFSLKATNLAFHLLTAFCVYFFCNLVLRSPALACSRLCGSDRKFIAILAAAIWALHPLHVSTVLYAVQRMAQLSTLGVLAGLIVFLRYRLKWAESGCTGGELLATALWLIIIAVMAVLSKENGAILIWLIPLLELTLFKGQWGSKSYRSLEVSAGLVFLAPLVVITIALLVEPASIGAEFGGREFTLDERLLTQSRILWQYLGWLSWPDIRNMGFHHDDIILSSGLLSPITTMGSLIAWLCAIVAAWLFRHRSPMFLFGLLFYLVSHSIESSFLPLEMVFEHRNYLPSVGVIIAFSFSFWVFFKRLTPERVGFVALLLTLGLFALCSMRSMVWSDFQSLAYFNVQNHPNSPRANFVFGQVLSAESNALYAAAPESDQSKVGIISARTHFVRTHELSPRDFAPLVMLHQIDGQFFPELPERKNWLPRLLDVAKSRPLQASDRASLDALVDYSLNGPGADDIEQVDRLLEVLLRRYPSGSSLVLMRYELLGSIGEDSERRRVELLSSYLKQFPHSVAVQLAAAQHRHASNMGEAYIQLGEGLKQDKKRRYLSFLKGTFE
ncbi:hypothetical protein EYC87_01290 [Halieaceae bacterium IMCC8485]|uniref:Uncharacterized protein n=1 Tax=Candidatus Seongchinamella marina TaxID=2518990 RepID=A0ABT3SQI7_9GAMM|nr:hypothetical protein [Candidatus Seongchinamella marina]MCX2972219.1 hypothetical protein [Candidatus Seongchinamella marina]